jgi:hypothetical protein
MDPLRALLIRDHGRHRCAHLTDTRQPRLVIGTGRCIDRDRGPGIYEDDILDSMLDHDIERHTAGLFAAWPWMQGLDPARLGALISLAIDPGIDWVRSDPAGGLDALREGRWERAAQVITGSYWAGENRLRATWLAEQLLTGQWPKGIA